MKKLLVFFLFIMLLIFCGSPQGPTPGPAQQGPNIAFGTLTEGEIQRFIKALPTFIEVVEKEGRETYFDVGPKDVLSAFQQMSILNREIATLDARMRAAGMGWTEFWPAYAKTMIAYTAIIYDSIKVELQKSKAKTQAELKQMEDLLKNPNLSESQKNAIKASMEAYQKSDQIFNQLDTIYAKVPQINKDIVKKYINTITEILKRD